MGFRRSCFVPRMHEHVIEGEATITQVLEARPSEHVDIGPTGFTGAYGSLTASSRLGMGVRSQRPLGASQRFIFLDRLQILKRFSHTKEIRKYRTGRTHLVKD